MASLGNVRVLAPGSRLGRYVVGERIARGGMAEVYLAKIEGIGGFSKPVALKLILPAFSDDLEFRRMFLAEARLVAGLDHPNIAQVIDVGEVDGELFIAMEYVHGQTLRKLIAGSDEVPPLRVGLFAVREACRALHYAHEARDPAGLPMGIVHRDISPSNLMARYDGEVKLLDFGVAKASSGTQATQSGVLKGKGGYMSPEQCLGTPLDRRSDIFALGILLYEITTHRRLFTGDNQFEVFSRIVEGRFRPPGKVIADYPPLLEELVMRALASSPDDRFQDALQFRLELEQVSATLGIEGSSADMASHVRAVFGPPPPLSLPQARDPSPAELPKIGMRGERLRMSWVFAAAVGVAFGGLGASMLRSDSESSSNGAPQQADTSATASQSFPPGSPASPLDDGRSGSKDAEVDDPDRDVGSPPPEVLVDDLEKGDAMAAPEAASTGQLPNPPRSTVRKPLRSKRPTKEAPPRRPSKREPLFPWSDE
jgi:eukaryotic-like serine/threonine-protein kinase